MTTNYIAGSPSQTQAAGIVNFASGLAKTDSGAASVSTFTPGFNPRYIKWVNVTDGIMHEWYEGMSVTAQSIKTIIDGTRSLETTDVIKNPGDGTFTVTAAIIVASKTHVWQAFG